MIKNLGGVFGRNPTFNNVEVEGDLTVDGNYVVAGDIAVTGNATIAGTLGVTGQITGNVTGNLTGNADTVTNGAYVNVDNNFSAFQTLQDGLEVTSDANISGTLSAGSIDTNLGTINGINVTGYTISSGPAAGNIKVGYEAGAALIIGATDNTVIGKNAGDGITTGDRNIAIGTDSLGAATTTVDCIAVGHNALLLNTVDKNIAIGARALDAVTTGTGNFAAGTDAASAITIGTNNFALGTNALKVATAVSNNVAIGFEALVSKTTSGDGNVAIGTSAMYRATTNFQSTAVGFQSQFGSTSVTGQGNTSLGYNSLVSLSSASFNSAFGIQALYALTSGNQNTACGLESLFAITTTGNNTGVGTSALRNITNGANNIGIGHSAARYKTASNVDHTLSGDSNIYIGYQSRASGDSVTKEVVIGSVDALGLGSNTTVIGTSTTLGNRIFGVASTGQVAPTIASATTIAPTTSIVFISGTTAIATITAPSTIATTGGQITLIPTGIFTTTTTGNIALASTTVAYKALIMTYDAGTAKWYPSY